MSEPDLIERQLAAHVRCCENDVQILRFIDLENPRIFKDAQTLLAEAQAALDAYQKIKALPDMWEWAANLGTHTVAEINAQQTGWHQCANELSAALRGEEKP